jgi:hypothetical protein
MATGSGMAVNALGDWDSGAASLGGLIFGLRREGTGEPPDGTARRRAGASTGPAAGRRPLCRCEVGILVRLDEDQVLCVICGLEAATWGPRR